MTDDSYLRLQARTARFTLGRPRGFTVSPDGARVLFLRSRGGTDRVTCLWSYEVATGTEVLLADPVELLAADLDSLPDAERARRERAREQAAGIVAYSTDAQSTEPRSLCRVVSSWWMSPPARASELAADGLVFDPHVDPTGRVVAYATRGTLRVVNIDDGSDRELIGEPGVTWGLAEFVAAEEMDRQRGFWWAPDGESLLAARVDESGVQEWHIGDPSNPDRVPHAIRYPAAGTANAVVSLSLLHLDGRRTDVSWDADAFPYLVSARWRRGSPPLLQLASRDQRTMRIVDVDVDDGLDDPRSRRHRSPLARGRPGRARPASRWPARVHRRRRRHAAARCRRPGRVAGRAAGARRSRLARRRLVHRINRTDGAAPLGLFRGRRVRGADNGTGRARRHRRQ